MSNHNLSIKECLAKMSQEEYLLREMLWARHGCQGIYGDDGERQCGECRLDFIRDTPQEIAARFDEIAMQKFVQTANPGKE